MPSARPSRYFGKVLVLAVIPVSLLTVYLLLSSGFMGGIVKSIVNEATKNSEVSVDVYGGKSDIFGRTCVDSVIVENEKGLMVGVYGATAEGSVYDYFLRQQIKSIQVDSLVIVTPLPSDEPPEDSTLVSVFGGTMAGFVTRTGSLRLDYGRVEQYDGTVLVDSMRLDASVIEINNPLVEIHQAETYIPLLGWTRFTGELQIDSTRVSIGNSSVAWCPVGEFVVSGFLNSDSTVNFNISGNASTAFVPDIPFATASVDCSITGSIPAPEAILTIPAGGINYHGLMVGMNADTMVLTREKFSVDGFHLKTGSIEVDADGNLQFSDLSWSGGVLAGFQGTDVSAYFPEAPETEITGTLNARGRGTSGILHSMEVQGNFTRSRVMDFALSHAAIYCSGNTSGVQGSVSVDLEGGELDTDFELQLGVNYAPVSWSAASSGYLANLGAISAFTDPLLMNASGLSMDISGEGNLSSFSVSGSAGLESFSTDSLQAAGALFQGSFFSRPEGIGITGRLTADTIAVLVPEYAEADSIDAFIDMSTEGSDVSGLCSLQVAGAEYGNFTLGSLQFTGEVDADNEGITGNGQISADSIFSGSSGYSLDASVSAVPGMVRIDTLTLDAPGNLKLNLSGLFSYGPDSLDFSLYGIGLTRAGKLRLISAGDIKVSTDSTGLQLDTLWLDLPSGEITADGMLFGDSLELSALLSNVDIASFISMVGMPVPVSGILQAGCSVSGTVGNMQTVLDVFVDHPTYDEWNNSDSLTISVCSSGDSLLINGLWSWADGVRSGLRAGFDSIWNESGSLQVGLEDVMWLEAELSGVGDELFYLLPMPFKTSGASVNARVEYQRESGELSAGIASHFNKMYVTTPGIQLPGVTMYLTYPDMSAGEDFNGSLSINSGEGGVASLQSTLLFRVGENLTFAENETPVKLEAYDLRTSLTGWETLVAGVGWLKLSGTLSSRSSDITVKPKLIGKIEIDQAVISMSGDGAYGGSGGTSGQADELPLDLRIKVSGDREIWFRNSFANAEFAVDLDLTTPDGALMVGGDIDAIRGGVYLLGREFRITTGGVRILQTAPMSAELDIVAESRIRSSISGAEYNVTVTLKGDPEKPEMTLQGTGPDGAISEQDIVTLLTAGMTYGELQQFDSTALGSVAGSYLGQWLARSIRDDVGLDALQFTPDFSSDTTSLVVNAGKYVLPDLFVSYSSDVFSSDAGTISAQYFFSRDLFLEGSTKSTLTGSHDPSLELHYTYRY
ncbi:hypothetical protein CSA37_03570 [Candidatus Fermentibacteria bacterium]|nr:MAG: hypothetical protein CSA37_03570 [Candidatus Fermentibacteria bacterium]